MEHEPESESDGRANRVNAEILERARGEQDRFAEYDDEMIRSLLADLEADDRVPDETLVLLEELTGVDRQVEQD